MFHVVSSWWNAFSYQNESGDSRQQSPFVIALQRIKDGYRAFYGALLAFFVLLAITGWLWRDASEEVSNIARERFMFNVAEEQFAIKQRLLAYEQVLRGGVGLFAASEEVTRDEWRDYVRVLNVEKNYPGIRGIGFSKRILPAQMKEHLRKIRAEISPEYTIRPGGERAEYTSIIYLEPFDWRNQRAFGYDMFSEPVRREAMERARDTGAPSASRKVKLVQETSTEVQNGFLMYLPVFQKGAPLQTAEQRRAALSGYVYAPFRMSDLMQGILGWDKRLGTRLEIFDGDAISPEGLMYDNSPEGSASIRPMPSAFTTNQVFELNGRKWTLRFSSLPSFDATIDMQKPRTILISGAMVSILFAAVVWFASSNRRRAGQLAAANIGLKAEIDERTKLEADLKLAKNAAEAANQAKSEFLANVSHELRTPLTLVLAPLEQLSAAAAPPVDWRVHIDRMTRNAMLLLNRVNDILDFSKAEAGKFDVHWEDVDLATLIGPLLDDTVAVACSKGRTLTWSVDAALGMVSVDSRHLEKILLNLVSNALKFTPEGGWVRLTVTPLDAVRYELSVADSGIGIVADKLPELFNRFHQVDTSATRQYSGSGIGLALVKQLVELMQGEVGVESEAGRGSRFFVRLPRACRMHGVAASSQESSFKDMDASRIALRRVRLDESSATGVPGLPAAPPQDGAERPCALVADDNADMRRYIAGLLGEDCAVTTVDDGLQAWALLQRQPFDIVVSDAMMPGLDGLGLTARIKADPLLARVPVILVTARGGAEASTTGLACGADDYIAKPFSPSELKARVHAALRMAQMQARLCDLSREAGMAMLASGILHNVGNMLCNVTVSAAIIQDTLRQSDLGRLDQVAGLLRSAGQKAGEPIPPELPAFIEQLAQRLRAEREKLLSEAANLCNCTEYAAGIVTAQQRFAKAGGGLVELVSVGALLDTALALSQSRIGTLGVTIERHYASDGAALVDRYKVLQILLNLIANAADALHAVPAPTRRLIVRTVQTGPNIHIEIRDTGSGIDARHVPTLFNQGFSTKGDGHGYGLHLSAIWARESGGMLRCHSDGPGCGATFILELPCPDGGADTADRIATQVA